MLDLNQRLAEFLRQFAMRREVNLVVLQNLLVDKGLQQIVDVVAAQVRIAVRGKHLIDVAFARGNQLEDGNIKGAAAQIVNGHLASLLFVQPVSQGRGRWFVYQAQHFQTGELAGILGGLALRIVEISGHRDDSAIYSVAEIGFRPIL